MIFHRCNGLTENQMKRHSYILLMLAAVLAASCSKHLPDPGQPGSPSLSGSYIFFEPEVVEHVDTRTTMVEGNTLPLEDGTAFGVMGYAGGNAIFNNATYHPGGIAKVTRNGAGAEAPFTYQGLVQWRDASTIHNFYAYYPYSMQYLIKTGTNNVPYIEYTQQTDETKMTDILTAHVSTSKVPIVNLGFGHRLWALDLTVANTRTKKDSLYNAETKQYEEYDPVIKVKSIKFEFDGFPRSGLIHMDGNITIPDPSTQNNMLPGFTKSYSGRTLNPGTKEALNGSNSFLFLPCGSFRYRLTVEFENALGLSYTSHHPSTYLVEENGNPALDTNGQIQWDWATASGPDTNKDGIGDGFAAGKRYTLDIVKADFEVKFVWTESDWGEWNGEEWVPVRVDHTFI